MQTIAIPFLLTALALVALGGCASTSGDGSADPVVPPKPSQLETQEQLQQMHSDVLRREF